MSEYIDNYTRRREALKGMLRQLNAGQPVEQVKAEFQELLVEVDATEIAMLEQALIEEGVPETEIKRLCDVHVAVFEDALRARAGVGGTGPAAINDAERTINGWLAANRAAGQTLDALQAALRSGVWGRARFMLGQLRRHEQHYVQKENVLFPYLEKHGFSGPSSVMWAIHDDIRAGWKQLEALLNDTPEAERVAAVFEPLATAMRQMFYKEEHILFPTARQLLTAEEWTAISRQLAQGEPAVRAGGVAAPAQTPNEADRLIPLEVGALSAQQIALMLTHLPVDITFVDEHDEVRFYSAGWERIFNRTPAIIGRKVQQCHPPASVHRVQRILDDFRAGRRQVAEFWIQMGAPEAERKFIHIRYFALRDKDGRYCGTLEVTQDVTAIRALQGERRLLAEGE